MSNGKVIVNIDPEMQELVPIFLDNRKKDIIKLMDALNQGDFETVKFLGHNMKGTGSGYGFDEVTEFGKALEQAAKDKNIDETRLLIGKLVSFLDNVQVEYK